MDSKYLLLICCLVFAQETVKGCVDIVEDFLIFRDGLLRYFTMCDEMDNMLDSIEDFLGFPFTSDQRWRMLLCDLATVDDISDLETVLSEHIEGPIDKDTLFIILMHLPSQAEEIPGVIEPFEKYQRKLQPWLAKTNFPHTWPVRNTGKKETARMMAKGDDTQVNLLTYDGYHADSDYNKWAKALLRAASLEEYLSIVSEDMIEDVGSLQCFTAMQDIFRDTEEFRFIPETAQASLRVIEHLEQIGLFDLIPDYYY